MDNKEEDGVDDDASDRDARQAASGAGRWEGGGGLWAHCHHQHNGGHRDSGAQADRGKFDSRRWFWLLGSFLADEINL
jgi:hypothetical protein